MDINNKDVPFEQLFEQHIEFAKKAFPNSTWKSSLHGLIREIEEINHAMFKDDSKLDIAIEYVDCFMYLLDSMQRAGVSIEYMKEAFIAKIEINKSREWIQNQDRSYGHKK